MKIKVALLDQDKGYLSRIISVFTAKYSDKFEVYSFTDLQTALQHLDSARIDVFVASDLFEIDVNQIPKRCSFAYLVEASDIETLNNQITIHKFQRADQIYKQILSLYSENAANITGFSLSEDKCKFIAFTSPSGGVGSSSMAAACAKHFAAAGLRTLYLNLETFGAADSFFSGEGQFDMSDVIYALKSKKTNLAMKLESCVKQDASGVFFFSQSKIALDMMELEPEDIQRLVQELKLTGSYDVIAADVAFSLKKESLKLYRNLQHLVLLSDGSEIANAKLFRAYTALNVIDEASDAPLTRQMYLLYNKFSSKIGKVLDIELPNIGGAPKYENAPARVVVDQLARMDVFDKIR